ncbi:MAG: hypothetical protein IKP86_04990 [Anaerolineaceae bacterium]|nr:hypothetical protein [Anaerolineaceae bacterium]
MKNKYTIIYMFICVLLFCTAMGNVSAEDDTTDVMVPESLAAGYNETLRDILKTRHGNDFSEEELAELADYVSVTFTENNNSVSYFNNPDWTLELSAYYDKQEADPAAAAHAITFSIPNDMNQSLAYDIHIAYLSALSVCEPSLSTEEFLDKVHNAINQADTGAITVELSGYRLTLFSYNGRNFYGLEEIDTETSL